jgi:hypothetical protein
MQVAWCFVGSWCSKISPRTTREKSRNGTLWTSKRIDKPDAKQKLMRGVSRILGFKMTNDLLNILQINLFVSMCHRSNLVRTNLRSPPKIT